MAETQEQLRTQVSYECCPQCEEPKSPYRQELGAEKEHGWPGCINPECIAFGEQMASCSFHRSDETVELLQTRLNQMRRALLDRMEAEAHDR